MAADLSVAGTSTIWVQILLHQCPIHFKTNEKADVVLTKLKNPFSLYQRTFHDRISQEYATFDKPKVLK